MTARPRLSRRRFRCVQAALLALLLALTATWAPAAPPSQLPWLADGARQARIAVRLLGAAAAHGLDPERYGAADLARRLDGPHPPADAAALERDLSGAVAHYLADLHQGRAPSAYRGAGDASGFDPAALLARAFMEQRLEQAVDAAAPAIPLYPRVMASLAHYRELARLHPQWPALPAPAGSAAGDSYPGADLLRERLLVLGDLGADSADGESAPGVYSAGLAHAVRRFQARHGLAEDGVLGPRTLAALSVPLPQRVAQLALTLERLRWLPPLPQGRMVAVNLPAYRLWAFDSSLPDPGPPLEMRIIVGTAARTPTPLFIGQMRYLELNPYWNVPHSIAVGEILPKLAHNPAYLVQNDMEVVAADGRVLAAGGAAQAAVRAGSARIRQRPGPRNVLGALKFAMPNPMNIYLHSTSSRDLFERSRRDLSHGCIRVEAPVALARFLLADPQRWDEDGIETAIKSGRTRTLPLPAPVPVVLFYATAVSDRGGRVLFADDIYRQDAPLIEMLGLAMAPRHPAPESPAGAR
jgi:L,D-transpeptidase YcbB